MNDYKKKRRGTVAGKTVSFIFELLRHSWEIFPSIKRLDSSLRKDVMKTKKNLMYTIYTRQGLSRN
jgi:hypothetical protein